LTDCKLYVERGEGVEVGHVPFDVWKGQKTVWPRRQPVRQSDLLCGMSNVYNAGHQPELGQVEIAVHHGCLLHAGFLPDV
jgi:hypothetical protein